CSNPCNAAVTRWRLWPPIIPFRKSTSSTSLVFPACTFSNRRTPAIPPTGGYQIRPAPRPSCAVLVLQSSVIQRKKCLCAAVRSYQTGHAPSIRPDGQPAHGRSTMIEAIMFWNEPNNKSHWAFEVDPDWQMFAHMIKHAAQAVAAENPHVLRVLGGLSPIYPMFIANMRDQGVLEYLDVVAVHGFPLDWNHWSIHEWPDKLQEIQAVTPLPVWVSEAGASSFGAEGGQAFGPHPAPP